MGNKRRLFGFLLILGMLSIVVVSQWGTNTANAETVASPEKAEYVLDEDFSILATSYDSNDIVASGWDVRKAGGSLSYSYNNWFKISDTSNLLPVSMTKKFVSSIPVASPWNIDLKCLRL